MRTLMLRDWLRLLRANRIGLLAAAVALSSALVILLPATLPVPLREASANPWSVLWAIPALVMPFVASPGVDFMLRALPFRLEVQRLIVVAACVWLAVAAIVTIGLITGQPVDVGLRNLLGCIGVSLMITTVLAGDIAALLLFVTITVAWVFGREPYTGQPYPWVLLLTPATWLQVASAGLVACAGALVWARYGAYGGRR
jgi:hypothetical protein